MNSSTLCVHAGTHRDPETWGVNTPIYSSTAFDYRHSEQVLYPRYFQTPNQKSVIDKICSLENGEDGLIFSSGMAAIYTSLFAHLKEGDHIIVQADIYGGTQYLVNHFLQPRGIDFDLAIEPTATAFESLIKTNTRIIYIETPSNPLLKVTDIAAVASLAKSHGLLTVIDNTFASPINQKPLDLGIDISVHSGTKYLSGHSDICFGAVVASKEHMAPIHALALAAGGTVEAQTAYLIERSLKTLDIRMKQHNSNAMTIAKALQDHPQVAQVNYPGLADHPSHHLAASQMSGFGGMLSFELSNGSLEKSNAAMNKLKVIMPAVSLGGVESLICSPALTSHSKISAEERKALGISDGLLRLSVGIEDAQDIINDLQNAIESA